MQFANLSYIGRRHINNSLCPLEFYGSYLKYLQSTDYYISLAISLFPCICPYLLIPCSYSRPNLIQPILFETMTVCYVHLHMQGKPGTLCDYYLFFGLVDMFHVEMLIFHKRTITIIESNGLSRRERERERGEGENEKDLSLLDK